MATDPSNPEPAPAAGGRLPALGVGLSLVVVFIAVLSIVLKTAVDLGLTAGETTAWIIGGYGVGAVFSLLLVPRYRQPLFFTGNVFIIIFVATVGTRFAWAELVGATMVAGILVLALGLLGLPHRLVLWLPPPIVYGLLAGALLPFFVDVFNALGTDTLIVGGTLVIYVLARIFVEPRIPAILPAIIAALLTTAIAGEFGSTAIDVVLPAPTLTTPEFSLSAILTITPILVAIILVQANVPSEVFLREQKYEPPEQTVNTISGVGTMGSSFLGPLGISLSLPATALVAGPDAGEHQVRYRAVYIPAAGAIVISLLAGMAAQLANIVPSATLTVIFGLAVVGILSDSLGRITAGPLFLGPLFAFAVTLSDIELIGLGSFFWALAIGLAVSRLLERDGWNELHQNARVGLESRD